MDPRNQAFEEKTKGIKLWSQPFYKEEENLSVFFVDVEGFDFYDDHFRNFVWSVSFLMGSVIFFSSKGELSSLSIKNFDVFKFLLENVLFSESIAENEYTMSYYAPKFVWLFKDYLIDEED